MPEPGIRPLSANTGTTLTPGGKTTRNGKRGADVRLSRERPVQMVAVQPAVPSAPGGPCAYATEHAFDLLVLGRHGDGGTLHPRLGRVPEAAARASAVSLLLVS